MVYYIYFICFGFLLVIIKIFIRILSGDVWWVIGIISMEFRR